MLWTILITGLVFPFVFYYYLQEEYKNKIREKTTKLISEKEEAELLAKNNEIMMKKSDHKAETWKQILIEKTSGFPTLFNYIELYDKIIDDYVSNTLVDKVRPAARAAEEVKDQSKRRRDAEKELRITQQIINFYEELEPSLVEYKNEEFGNIEEILKEWTEEEKADPVSYFISKDDYRKLPSAERNQLALEKYWTRPHSKWHVGIMYERYVGYIYEKEGYTVNYHGAKEGKRDMGRDLIASKGNLVVVIQCKYWSQFKSVFENEIFQFFGTVFQYKKQNKGKRVRGIFYTTTKVSDLARDFAEELGIELKENFKMDKTYPCIKCNVSGVNKTKIYHLPFDQQYDHVLIEPKKGEFYCKTAQEAEKNGFRRAWRWGGQGK